MTTYTISPYPRSEFEPSPRWVRVYFNGQLIADSRNMMLLRENNRLPLYYFPKNDVRMDCLQPSDHTTDSGPKGEGVFWHVKVGDKVADLHLHEEKDNDDVYHFALSPQRIRTEPTVGACLFQWPAYRR